jgi:hypothetical protein
MNKMRVQTSSFHSHSVPHTFFEQEEDEKEEMKKEKEKISTNRK